MSLANLEKWYYERVSLQTVSWPVLRERIYCVPKCHNDVVEEFIPETKNIL